MRLDSIALMVKSMDKMVTFYRNVIGFPIEWDGNGEPDGNLDERSKGEYINELHKGDKGIVFATGTPISMVVMNTNQQSSDYSEIAKYYRPGHADPGQTAEKE